MVLTSWLGNLRDRLSSSPGKTPRRRMRRQRRNAFASSIAACVQILEDRTLLSSVSWVGTANGGDGLKWNVDANWSGGATPGAGDDVTIADQSGPITVSGAPVNLQSLTLGSGSNIEIQGTSFTISAPSTVNSTLTVCSGANLIINGATIDGTGQITNTVNGAMATVSATINVEVENDGNWEAERPGVT